MTTNNINTKEEFSPTNDYLFKRIFGYKGNEKITQRLIETLLDRKCEVLEVTSDEVTERDLRTDKLSVLDIYVKMQDKTQINIEMQVVKYSYIVDRMLFYWAKKYTESIRSGNQYEELRPTKVILIANFEIENLSELKEIINTFKILDTKTGKIVLTQNFELVIIELPKMKKYKTKNKEAENWLKFIQNPNSLGEIDLEENEELKQAKEEYDKIIADDHEKMMIRLREKYWLDYNSMRSSCIKEGKEERQKNTVWKNGREERYETTV